MKKIHQYMRPLFTKYLALPSDAVHELPRITMIGQIHAYIENHKGISVFTDTELRLRTINGYIQLTGNSFVLKLMLPEEVLLEGKISDVKFIPEKE
ncbi:sporulation protein YqfC [Virgibacillus sp. 179-BFC.A HS]|uniref:Sporulation protein YqfC n=1 Tax=Tigheibacillus jepli TaxID=3035914 RepID=A0ABU5CGT8_9BACI|nr:sporulation protein YqfC [Virgibacillus sp. 179-BFC.A HS]MDY0405534.1 sporulation protein YqfC [Virgibacillus sp. 179-BFC.A HS]